ncbi:MAG: hypothetical protein J6M16_02560 [Clostridia bacterium]|nr:hypothetical protein [Clostridia bacterium]
MLKNEKKYLKADSLDFDYSVLDEAGDLDEDEFQVPVSFLKSLLDDVDKINNSKNPKSYKNQRKALNQTDKIFRNYADIILAMEKIPLIKVFSILSVSLNNNHSLISDCVKDGRFFGIIDERIQKLTRKTDSLLKEFSLFSLIFWLLLFFTLGFITYQLTIPGNAEKYLPNLDLAFEIIIFIVVHLSVVIYRNIGKKTALISMAVVIPGLFYILFTFPLNANVILSFIFLICLMLHSFIRALHQIIRINKNRRHRSAALFKYEELAYNYKNYLTQVTISISSLIESFESDNYFILLWYVYNRYGYTDPPKDIVEKACTELEKDDSLYNLYENRTSTFIDNLKLFLEYYKNAYDNIDALLIKLGEARSNIYTVQSFTQSNNDDSL